MRTIKFIVALLITIGFIGIADTTNPFGSDLPALGRFFSPFHGFWKNAERPDAFEDKTIELTDLKRPVKIVFDDRLVPHIFAQTDEDAYFALGYLHAKFRLFQMEMASRSALGEISEVLGERAINYDKNRRRIGIGYGVDNSMPVYLESKEDIALLDPYTKGVNSYVNNLQDEDIPVEFKLLGVQPGSWSIRKCMSILGNFAYTLCFRHRDLGNTNMRSTLGDSLFTRLFPEYNPKDSPIIPSGTLFLSEEEKVSQNDEEELMGALPVKMPTQPDEALGSNNWAVAPEKTKNKNPILSSDPHLSLTLPSIWYEVHINTPDLNVYGVTTPGLPMILIGFNENVAYGVTNAGWDVLDWYSIKWTDEKHTKYLYDGEEKEVTYKIEEIKVKGSGKTILDTVKYTIWGPVVYEDSEDEYDGMSMRWLLHETPEKKPFLGVAAFSNLMRAKSFEDYKNALTGFDLPAQNFAFASRNGDIAMTVNGRLPIKREQQGRFIQDGSKSSNGWAGFIPRDRLPAMSNPDRGFISSANQVSTDSLYPYYYNGQGAHYRGRIINDLLENMENITVEQMKEMQMNDYSLLAEEALAVLIPYLKLDDLTEEEVKLMEELKTWDNHYKAEAKAPVLFDRWLRALRLNTYDEIYDLRDSMEIASPRNQNLIHLFEQYDSHKIFDLQKTEKSETAADIITMSFQDACSVYKTYAEEDKQWGKYRGTVISHLGNIPGLASDFLPIGGHSNSINATTRSTGPSWRMVVELADAPVAFGVYPGGQSGNPGSAYYDNFINNWVEGNHFKLQLVKKAEALENTLYTLNLE